MSVGFSFACRVKRIEELLSSARQLARERGYRFFRYPEENGFTLGLCPMGGELHFRWRRRGGLFPCYELEGDCQSTPAGPGLHKAAADAFYALDQIGEQKFRFSRLYFGDETGYFDHWSFEKSVREHFHPWLAALLEMCCQRVLDGTDPQMCLCWRTEQYVPKEVPGTLVTPVGRFSARSLREMAQTQGIEAVAERFFLWYHPEPRDALYCRNLALNLLWEECRYLPSSRGEEDRRLNDTILDCLEEAARLDPALPLPRRSYEEVCALAGREPRLREGPAMEEEFFPGYRKEPVTYTAGPLRLTLSGAYRRVGDRWEDGPGPVWQVRRGERLTGPGGETGELAVDGGTVRWSWREEDRVLQAEAGGCLITAACQTPAERLDAMELLGKLAIKG